MRITGKRFLTSPWLTLNNRKIYFYSGELILEKKEKEKINKYCQKIWKQVAPNDFRGLIRFDLVPDFEKTFAGIYEINTDAPQGACAWAMICKAFLKYTKGRIDAVEKLVKAIKTSFGERKIIFLPSYDRMGQEWGRVYVESLKRFLRIEFWTPRTKIKDSEVIYRFGRVDLFLKRKDKLFYFWKKIKNYPLVFNSLNPSWNPGDKSLLIKKGFIKGAILDSKTISLFLKNHKIWVLKPSRGSYGKGIVFGALVSFSQWRKVLYKALKQKKKYLVTEAIWLPKVNIGKKSFAFDLNSAFWAEGRKLKYLYSIFRIDLWSRYWQRRTINVAQGAAFGGTVTEEK